MAVFCGLAVVSQLFTLIVQWIHCLDESIEKELTTLTVQLKANAKVYGKRLNMSMKGSGLDTMNLGLGKSDARCKKADADRSRALAAMHASGRLTVDILETVRIRRQLLAAAYVQGGDDWYDVIRGLDADGDGQIGREELATWIRSVLPAKFATESHITAIFQLADRDGSGDLEVDEVAWLLDSVQQPDHGAAAGSGAAAAAGAGPGEAAAAHPSGIRSAPVSPVAAAANGRPPDLALAPVPAAPALV